MRIKVLTLLLLLFSCSEQNPHARYLKENLGKKVSFSFSTITKGDIEYDYEKFRALHPYVVINYIREDCGVCAAKLYEWNEKHNELPQDTLLAYLFIFHGEDFNSFKNRVIGDVEFPFYLIMDTCNLFLSKNTKFPNEILHNTILVDNKDRLCAIGEPLNSDQIKDMYIKILKHEY